MDEIRLSEDLTGEETQKLLRYQKLLLYWMLGLIYVAFICVQIDRSDRLMKFNWSLHTSELLSIPATLSVFCVPVLFIIYIYFLIKYLRKTGVKNPKIKTVLLTIIVIASVVIVFTVTDYQSHEVTTGGIFKVENKIQAHENYFLVLNGKKISVSRNEYYLVDVKKEYMADYVWNTHIPNKGRLITIEPIKK